MSESVLDDETLMKVEEVLRTACGLTLAHSLRRSLETALSRSAEARGVEPDSFLRGLLLRDSQAVETFIEHAVIGETYFFRHPEHLRSLARLAAPKTGPFFNVWSAGCATGEEPYSIAMALLSAGVPEARIRVLATDVSGRALERAKEGLYGPWSLRHVEPDLERQYLERRGEQLSVVAPVRKLVEFRRHNLATDAPPLSGLSAIFCRNVLIYFPPDLVRRVLATFLSVLAPGGLLFVSPAEVPLTNGLGLEAVDAEGSVALRVATPGEAPSEPPVPRAVRRVAEVLKAAARLVPPSAPKASAIIDGLSSRPQMELHPPAAPRAPEPPAAPAPRAGTTPAAGPMERAVDAARAGRFEEAEALAREAAKALVPEAYLLLAMVAEGRGDLNGAVEAVRKALYLEPRLALGHATLVALYGRLERPEDAERARQNALRALDGLDDEQPLRGVETMTAGGLRQALAPRTQAGWQGAR
ncbi:chemotaxis protein methyltransferase CheR [Myxococcus stipitatus DSM 14675]|uniref:Chemotaxis protein methyltransferase CheR n=1 Tax=Myxococcus stipitatus (strain DSM 14675 / JCM 12634 / Mx s8) TaxID=1278073 RepID=L7U8I2_MYXSD|nr:protein-glutamate O-methyltransferase CheR [Myxococcus stipitatus]AGC44398.1 chemotaxis protein methyltransferase CheR [Myxococcus stipitatus DSM 14675]